MPGILAASLPVTLETLDPQDNPLITVSAELHHLDGEGAILHLPADTRGMYWGARVRFGVGEGARGYQVIGMVVGHREVAQSDPQTGIPLREIVLRLWECLPALQRRSGPRRRVRFIVRYLPLLAGNNDKLPAHKEWLRAWCVDLGSGGMRLHLARPLCLPEQLVLQFSLPLIAEESCLAPRREFQIRGRVVRCTAYGRHGDHIEMAVSFQRLSVEDGLALFAFLGK